MTNKAPTNNKKMNPILWFLFAIVIPAIVAIVLIVVILSIAGVNVKDWAKQTGANIPIVSSFIETEEAQNIEELEERLDHITKKKDTEIEDLNQTIENLESIIERLEQDKIKLENKYEGETNLEESADPDESKDEKSLKTVSSSFRKMNNKQAALIFEKLEKDVAISILEELSNDVRGNILEAMEPELAAELTERLIRE